MADDVASWVLAVFTIVLVFVTGYYAFQTKRLAVLQKQTFQFEQEKYQAETQPRVFVTFEKTQGADPSALTPYITNVSSVPAMDVEVNVNAKEELHFFGHWVIPSLLPGETRSLSRISMSSSNLGGISGIEIKA
ncbi:MAG: hypothetical protein ABR986_08570, partial [Methanomassiliicoccales archaeon]